MITINSNFRLKKLAGLLALQQTDEERREIFNRLEELDILPTLGIKALEDTRDLLTQGVSGGAFLQQRLGAVIDEMKVCSALMAPAQGKQVSFADQNMYHFGNSVLLKSIKTDNDNRITY
jgi:hypothetical protein